ncbi:MAG: SRPBCC family protein, partial [Actinomycetota bacterium]
LGLGRYGDPAGPGRDRRGAGMNRTRPIVTFRAQVTAQAPPGAVYRVLTELRTHLTWAGEQAPQKTFRLLSLEAAGKEAVVGDRFSSTGANMFSMQFVDASLVVEADSGKHFGFDTDSKLERKHRPALHTRFRHRYTLSAAGGGTAIGYSCDVWPQNYVPWWLRAGQRPMTKLMVQRSIRRNLKNLATLAASTPATR